MAGTNASREASDERATTVRRTRRWRGVVAVVLVALAIGVLAKRPSLLLVAAVGVAFAAYPQLTEPPEPTLSVERRIAPESPAADETVEVVTTLRNEGEETLFDLRLVDGVPPMLSVEAGSPRLATALGPGEEATIEYSMRARRGTHRFRPTMVIARDASGATEVETTVVAETTIECGARVPEVPLRARSPHRTGQLVTDDGGSGLEFHRVKEYERGDPVSRIDWRRFARTGEFTSMEFRQERLAEVVLCVDAREAAYRASGTDEPHAVAHATDAAERIADTLFGADHRVGLAAFGRELCWLPPGSGRDHEDRFRRLLTTHRGLSLVPPQESDPAMVTDGGPEAEPDGDADGSADAASLSRQLSTLRTQLQGTTQVFFLTPLCDDAATRIVQTFETSGCSVTVISPDVTTDETVGSRLARLERQNRLTSLRNAGVPVVDWNPNERLGTALTALRRWVA